MAPGTRRNSAPTVPARLQTLQVVSRRQDGEVAHHAGPSQHSAKAQGIDEWQVSIDWAQGKRLCSSVLLTKSAAQTDSGRLKLPRRTTGCHKDG